MKMKERKKLDKYRKMITELNKIRRSIRSLSAKKHSWYAYVNEERHKRIEELKFKHDILPKIMNLDDYYKNIDYEALREQNLKTVWSRASKRAFEGNNVKEA